MLALRSPLLIVALVVVASCELAPSAPPRERATDDPIIGRKPHRFFCDPSRPNQPPRAPVIHAPLPGRIDVVPADLTISASAFDDADGDAHAASRYEILRQGEAVWALDAVDDDALTTAAFADGALLGDALDAGGLDDWEDYSIRVRHQDNSGSCSAWSDWSDEVPFRTDDGSSSLFDDTQVLTIDLEIPQTSVDAMNAQAFPPGCVQFERDYHPGTLRFGGEAFEGVGVRIKGGCGSSRDLNAKASFKVNFAWDDPAVPGCPLDRRFFGQKALTLNNGVQDGTFATERMGYRLYRAAGVPAPRTATVRVNVNGAFWGVYTNVETYSRRMLSRFFEKNDGMMYEGAYWCDIIPENVPPDVSTSSCFTREFDTDECTVPDDGADPTDWELLRQFSVQLRDQIAAPSFYPEVESFMDFDEVLSMWAVDATIAHWDAYSFHIVNNYRVYHDLDDGRWHIFPWGIDQTFSDEDLEVDPFSSSAIIMNACVADPECLVAFGARLNEVLDLYDQLDFASEAVRIHDQLQAHVYEDPRKETDNNGWESLHTTLNAWIPLRRERVRQYMSSWGL